MLFEDTQTCIVENIMSKLIYNVVDSVHLNIIGSGFFQRDSKDK